MNRFYVYKHIRLDTNQVFYIGIGTKTQKDIKKNTYTRAFVVCNRNKFWKNVTNKTEYKVEIVLEHNDYNFILNKEIELIKFYGKIIDKKGSLVNISDGGLGCSVQKYKVCTSKQKENLRNIKSKPYFLYDKLGRFILKIDSAKEIPKSYNISPNSITECVRNKTHTSKNYYIFGDYQGIFLRRKPKAKKLHALVRVKLSDTNSIFFLSQTMAGNYLGISRERIKDTIKRKGFYEVYSELNPKQRIITEKEIKYSIYDKNNVWLANFNTTSKTAEFLGVTIKTLQKYMCINKTIIRNYIVIKDNQQPRYTSKLVSGSETSKSYL